MNKCGLRGSTNYVGTVYTDCAGDMLELQSIRDAVKVMNKELKFAEKYSKYGKFVNLYISSLWNSLLILKTFFEEKKNNAIQKIILKFLINFFSSK